MNCEICGTPLVVINEHEFWGAWVNEYECPKCNLKEVGR